MEAPGARASVDDQGEEETCTLHSLAKCHVNGFQTQKFHNEKIDFEQEGTASSLLKCVDDTVSKFFSKETTGNNKN